MSLTRLTEPTTSVASFAYSALETILLTATPQIKENGTVNNDNNNNVSNSVSKIVICADENGTDKPIAKPLMQKNVNGFAVTYANSRWGKELVHTKSVLPPENAHVETPTKALFANHKSYLEEESQCFEISNELESMEQHSEQHWEEQQQQQQREQEQIQEEEEEEEMEVIDVNINAEASSKSNLTQTSYQSNDDNKESEKSKTVKAVVNNIAEEPSTLLFLTPTYRNKICNALLQLNKMNSIPEYTNSNSNQKVTENFNAAHVLQTKATESEVINRHYDGTSYIDVSGMSENVSKALFDNNGKESNSSLSSMHLCDITEKVFSPQEVYDLLKNALSKFEEQRDEEESKLLNNLHSEMNMLHSKYEKLNMEREELMTEKEELENELGKVVKTLEEVIKPSDQVEGKEYIQEMQRLLTEKELQIRLLENKLLRADTSANFHTTSTNSLINSDDVKEIKPQYSTCNQTKELEKNSDTYNSKEYLEHLVNDESSEISTMSVKTILMKMNEMQNGMSMMENTLSSQQERLVELENDFHNKELECEEYKATNSKLQLELDAMTARHKTELQELECQVEKLTTQLSSTRKELQTRTRKLVALQNERNCHITFSQELENFTRLLLQEQEEIFAKCRKLNSIIAKNSKVKLNKLIVTLRRNMIKECASEEKHDVSKREVIQAMSMQSECGMADNMCESRTSTANKLQEQESMSLEHKNVCCKENKCWEVKAEEAYEARDNGNSVNDKQTNKDIDSPEFTRDYDYYCENESNNEEWSELPAREVNKKQFMVKSTSGQTSKAIRLLEVRRRAIERIVQSLHHEIHLVMIACDKAQHYVELWTSHGIKGVAHFCIPLEQEEKMPNHNSKTTDNTVVFSKKSCDNGNNDHDKNGGDINNNNNDNYNLVQAKSTSPLPYRPFSISLPRNAKANIAHEIYEQRLSSKPGLSLSQESIFSNNNFCNVNNKFVVSFQDYRNTSSMQVDTLLDGGSTCPMPPPQLSKRMNENNYFRT